MTGVETVTILLCVVSGVVLIAVAWWVSGIHTVLVRLAVALEARHLELHVERAADKRTRDIRQKHYLQWLAETAGTLKKLQGLGEKLGEQQDTMVMCSTPGVTPPAPAAAPATVREPRQADLPLLCADAADDGPSDHDADTLCWSSPGSAFTLIGVGATPLTEPTHGAPRARELARQLEKPGP